MPTLIFRLRNVPEDEANDVRELLSENNLEWYETTAGNWGIAMPGIWIQNDSDIEQARTVINEYQQKRQIEFRERYQQDLESGEASTLAEKIKLQPLKMAGIVVFCLFILYVSINPFLQLIGYTR